MWDTVRTYSEKNCFKVSNETYLQISRIALGTKWGSGFDLLKIPSWSTPMEKKNFRRIMISFTQPSNLLKNSHFGLPFLDTFIYFEDGQLRTSVYHKPTDNRQYLHYSWCHSIQQKIAISYGLLVRAKVISTKEELL